MSQNPEVKLARNTELAFTEAHLIDLKPESCIWRYFFVFCYCPSVCLSVCKSVTFQYQMKKP